MKDRFEFRVQKYFEKFENHPKPIIHLYIILLKLSQHTSATQCSSSFQTHFNTIKRKRAHHCSRLASSRYQMSKQSSVFVQENEEQLYGTTNTPSRVAHICTHPECVQYLTKKFVHSARTVTLRIMKFSSTAQNPEEIVCNRTWHGKMWPELVRLENGNNLVSGRLGKVLICPNLLEAYAE